MKTWGVQLMAQPWHGKRKQTSLLAGEWKLETKGSRGPSKIGSVIKNYVEEIMP